MEPEHIQYINLVSGYEDETRKRAFPNASLLVNLFTYHSDTFGGQVKAVYTISHSKIYNLLILDLHFTFHYFFDHFTSKFTGFFESPLEKNYAFPQISVYTPQSYRIRHTDSTLAQQQQIPGRPHDANYRILPSAMQMTIGRGTGRDVPQHLKKRRNSGVAARSR